MGEQRGNDPAAWQYNIPDALGSVRQVVDTQGQVTLARSYDPFGGLLSVSGGAATAYGFAGEEQDPTTGQLYLRARNYNPATGRFLQQDSVIGNPADPRSLHRYAYAFNNPVNYTDPSGHMPPGGGGLLAGNNGSVLGGLSSNNSSVLSNSSPNRSVNGNNGWSGSSNPTPKQQSRGFLPSLLCSGINYLTNAVGLAKNLASFVGNAKAYLNDPGNPIHLRNAVQDLKNANKNMMNMADQFWETAIGAMDIGA